MQQTLLYLITRVTWDEKRRKNDLDAKVLRGYVVDPLKNDVSVFRVHVDDLTPVTTAQFLWDYVGGCGIRKEWKNI
jgi:hypothetical protein